MAEALFQGRWLLANGHVQSLLASSNLRRMLIRRRAQTMLAASREVIIEAGEGVRLQAFYSPRDNARGLVLLLHGWEGSVNSTYMLDAGQHLWSAGYAVARLNFRDHGETEHLNRGVFHSCRLDEVVGAAAEIARWLPGRPLFMAGFSLGGNFTLRVAARAVAAGFALRHIIAVSPVINPNAGLSAIEDSWWPYEVYFLRKWRRSLKRKQALYPELYDFDDVRRVGMRKLTGTLVERYTEFPGIQDYLDGYSVAGPRLAELAVPATIVTAADDPVIPVADFRTMQLPATAELLITPSGGHCGFIQDLSFRSWIAEFIVRRIERAQAA